MTRVKDLIADSSFTTAKGFQDLKPLVSILLPTYKRGDNGLFERAVNSILNQNFKNFELIIIDDASVDSTAEIIKKIMDKDPRVAVIRHAKNLGLAAVSEIEGYLKARGQKFFFAFDDNIFTKTGLEALVNDQIQHPEHKISYGIVRLHLNDKKFIDLGTEQVDFELLSRGNRIGNGGVLIDRAVFERIGFYDPHLALLRAWDWDLWLRAVTKFAFYPVKHLISQEYGVTQPDSLGNTVLVDWVAVHIWMWRLRNEQLSAKHILEYEIDNLPEHTGIFFQQTLAHIIAQRFKQQYMDTLSVKNNDGYIALVAGSYTVSLSIVFDVLPSGVVFITMADFAKDFCKYTAGAKCVIFVRDIPDLKIIQQLHQYNIPYYYYTDDHLFIIPQFAPTHCSKSAMYFIKHAHGLLASTPALAQELKHYFHLSQAPQVLTCIDPLHLDTKTFPNWEKFNQIDEIRIGWCSVGKEDGLIKMKQDLERLAKETNKAIHFFCVATSFGITQLKKSFQNSKKIHFDFLPIQLNYEWMLTQISAFRPHFLIHTHSNLWADIYPYKTFNYFLTALHTTAIPLITIRPPYHLIKEDKDVGEFIVSDGAEVTKKIKYYLSLGHKGAQQAFRQIRSFWDRTYPIENNQKVLLNLLSEHRAPSLQKFLDKLDNIPEDTLENIEEPSSISTPNTHTWKSFPQTCIYTFKYYTTGKPDIYRYPIHYNIKNLIRTFGLLLKQSCYNFRRKK